MKKILSIEHKRRFGLIEPLFSKPVYNDCFLIQLRLLLHNYVPKLDSRLTSEDLCFITEAKSVYEKHYQQVKRDTFMDPQFLSAYHKTERRSQALSLETLQLYLVQLRKTQQILIMANDGYAHCIGVPKLKTVVFDEASQTFKVQHFDKENVLDWISAVKTLITEWSGVRHPNRVRLQFMYLESLS